MSAKNFDLALKKVLQSEGGWSNNPKDPGGATMRGVIQRVYDGYRKRIGKPMQTVRQISEAELRAVYKAQYWDAVRADELPDGVDYVVFDGAVNSGPKQSIKWLQRALGVPRVDGVIGESTLAACIGVAPEKIIAEIIHRRLLFLHALSTWKTFGKGWMARLDDVLDTGVRMARSQTVGLTSVVVDDGGSAKAPISDAVAAPARAPGDGVAGLGLGGIGASAALDQLRDQLASYSDIHWVGQLVAGIAVLGAIVTLGGMGYGWYARRRRADLKDALDLNEATP